MIKRLLTAGCISGLIAGLLLSLMQHVQVLPFIEIAERYERAALQPAQDSTVEPPVEARGEWMPQDGAERLAYTVVANLGMAVGFALLLCAFFVFFEPKIVWHGLLWGLAGYTVFFLAPALKLPPELPGAASDGLQTRQFWWIATVLCSALGLVGLVFCKSTMLKLLGGVILVLPHLLSGPQHQAFAGSVPDLLAHQFVIAVGTVNLLFWLSLGLATSWSFRLTHADAQR